VPIWVKHHPHILLGLKFCLGSSTFDGERHGRLEIVGSDVEVEHDQPPLVVGVGFEVDDRERIPSRA